MGMSMTEDKCDVCHINKPIGVASTSIPLSVAYCEKCAIEGADPESVFEYFYEMAHGPDEIRPELVTFKDGKYIAYKEWYALKTVELSK
jgi:hypothetical protein